MKNNKPSLCAIYAPYFDKLYWAKNNKGSYLNNKRLKIKDRFKNKFNTIIDNYSKPKGISKTLIDNLAIPNYYECGSISLKICNIAENKADLFVKDMQPRDWDMAAPDLVLSEAGGEITNINGKSIIYGKSNRKHNGLIATTSEKKLNIISKLIRMLN